MINRIVRPLGTRDGMGMLPVLARPKSRGTVTLPSKDYRDLPIVDINIYGDEADLELSVKGEVIFFVQLLMSIDTLI